jgi:hypothetical protein
MVGWLVIIADKLNDFGLCGTVFMNVRCYNRFHSKAVKGRLALWDNIYDYMCLLI